MTSSTNVIFVIAGTDATAREIKDLLEFMETDRVEIVAAGSWRETLGDRTLTAIFIGPDVPDGERHQILEAIGQHAAATSIVLLDAKAVAAA